MVVTVQWYGPLRERCGCEEELVTTAATTIRALWDEVAAGRGLPTREQLAVVAAVGDELVGWDRAIADGDVVAFLPPVSGG